MLFREKYQRSARSEEAPFICFSSGKPMDRHKKMRWTRFPRAAIVWLSNPCQGRTCPYGKKDVSIIDAIQQRQTNASPASAWMFSPSLGGGVWMNYLPLVVPEGLVFLRKDLAWFRYGVGFIEFSFRFYKRKWLWQHDRFYAELNGQRCRGNICLFHLCFLFFKSLRSLRSLRSIISKSFYRSQCKCHASIVNYELWIVNYLSADLQCCRWHRLPSDFFHLPSGLCL